MVGRPKVFDPDKGHTRSKFNAKRLGPFSILFFVVRSSIRFDVPASMHIHPVVHVEHTRPVFSQLEDIQNTVSTLLAKALPYYSESLIEIQEMLTHKKNGSNYSWLTLIKRKPLHVAQWQHIYRKPWPATPPALTGTSFLQEANSVVIIHGDLVILILKGTVIEMAL